VLTGTPSTQDSEIVALKLRNENIDRSGGDLRLKAAELAERHSEAQREVVRLREAAEAAALQVAALTEERDQLVAQVQLLSEQNTALSAEQASGADRYAAIQTEYEGRLRALAEQHAADIRTREEQATQLQADLALATNRLKQEADSAGNLDQYKKKAQLALKKVKATVPECAQARFPDISPC
jgi:chromosome segregation ATPase